MEAGKTSLKDFKIIRPIGEGAFGQVYLVCNKGNKKEYALKCMDKQFITKQKIEHHVFIEKLILQYLESDLTVKLIATFQDKRRLYYLLQYVPNGELAKYLREKGMLSRKTSFRRGYFLHSRDH